MFKDIREELALGYIFFIYFFSQGSTTIHKQAIATTVHADTMLVLKKN